MEKERIIEITSLEQPGVELFGALTEAQLRNRLEPEKGVFIAESPKVIRVALDAGYEPLALLCERKHLAGDAADILARCPDIPVYTGGRELLARLTGYTLTRGVLCAMRRPRCSSFRGRGPTLPSPPCTAWASAPPPWHSRTTPSRSTRLPSSKSRGWHW